METRLGDIIDDFCVKCKRIMNHAVVSILEGNPAKVRCRTCYNDHDYRHEVAPPPKVDPRKAALLKEALAKAPAAVEADPDLAEAGLTESPLLEEQAAAESVALSEIPVVEEAPKAKAKARGRK